MSLLKRTKRHDNRKPAAWAKTNNRNYSRLVFWLVLLGLIAFALIWSVSRDRAPVIALKLSDDFTPVIAQVNASSSLRQLRTVRDDASELLQTAGKTEIRPLLEVVDAATTRLAVLERNPEKQKASRLAQLDAFTELDRIKQGSQGELLWHRERFSKLAAERVSDPELEVRRAARRCQLLATQLQLNETRSPLEDLQSFDELIRSIVSEHPGDQELLALIEQVWERSPATPEHLPQLEQLTRVIEERFLSSNHPETIDRGKGLGERYWMVAWKLREKTEQAVLEQDATKLEELQRAALQLLRSNPTNEGIGVAQRLAAALEGNGMLEAATEILNTCRQLSATRASPRELAECHRLAEESLQRIQLIGQSFELELETLEATPERSSLTSGSSGQPPAYHTVILQFFGSGEELTALETFCGNLKALGPKGYRLVLVPCNLKPDEVDRLLLAEGQYRFETLTAEAVTSVQQALHQTATPRTIIIKNGKLSFSGLPNRRLYLDLEREAFTEQRN